MSEDQPYLCSHKAPFPQEDSTQGPHIYFEKKMVSGLYPRLRPVSDVLKICKESTKNCSEYS